MEIQNQVSRILRGNLARLRDVLDGAVSQGVGSLGQVADRVCEAFDFRDGRGRWQRASCCRALSDLQAAGHVSLPAGQPARGVGGRARVLPHPVAPAVDVPGTVDEVGGLTLVLVETGEQRRVWNTLMAQEHPRGAGPFVGPQLRYLVGSAHGWLGGVGFAASARRLRARDAWIGWDDTGRRSPPASGAGTVPAAGAPRCRVPQLGLPRVGPGRPGGRRRLRAARYGYRPWLLETFVDETEQTGASMRAANWVRVGETRGRGRQDRTHAASETRKAVYMYALEPGWRAPLASARAGLWRRWRSATVSTPRSWAGNEFGGARLGDARLSARLVLSARQMGRVSDARHPRRRERKEGALVKGHYRLIDQPAESAVTVDNILAPHRECTLRRMQDARHGAVHPGRHPPELHPAKPDQGLGVIGSNQTGAVARGLDLHTTLAVNPDGVALGVLRAAFDAPEPPNPAEKGEPTPKPREERKSFRWVEGLRDCAEAAERLGEETRVVCTMDREADFLDLFVERRAHAPAGRLAGPREGRPRPRQGEDGRRADGLAPSVRRGAQRAGPRRRQGRGAAAERAGEGQQTGPQGPPCGRASPR